MKYWVYLFGSYARNDYDLSSDLDILIIKNKKDFDISIIENKIKNIFNKKANYSIYSKDGIKKYYEKGHLFSWHLFLESRYLFSNTDYDILKKIGKPNPYNSIKNDISDFYYLFVDVKNELLNKSKNKTFEIGNFYSVIRNMYFYYVYQKTNKYDFSPYAYYKNITDEIEPISFNNYKQYKMAKQLRSIGDEINIEIQEKQINNDINNFNKWIKENFSGQILPKNQL